MENGPVSGHRTQDLARSGPVPGLDVSVGDLIDALPGATHALLLYGSRARGSHRVDSDVDLLQLVEHAGSTLHWGPANINRYDPESLIGLMKRGSLFARHLIAESVVLYDPSDLIREIYSKYREPASWAPTKSAIAAIATALKRARPESFEVGVGRAAWYCARTALYIASIEKGQEHFDAVRIATDLGFSELASLPEGPDRTDYLFDLSLRLTAPLLPKYRVPEDFESALVQLVQHHPSTADLAAKLVSVDRELPYSTLTLPFA